MRSGQLLLEPTRTRPAPRRWRRHMRRPRHRTAAVGLQRPTQQALAASQIVAPQVGCMRTPGNASTAYCCAPSLHVNSCHPYLATADAAAEGHSGGDEGDEGGDDDSSVEEIDVRGEGGTKGAWLLRKTRVRK